MEKIQEYMPLVIDYGIKVLGALVALFVAFMVAGWVKSVIVKRLTPTKLDTTLTKFFGNVARYVVLIMALLACLSIFGIETTSFAAVLGAAGLAVGLAFQGTLGNFAAGIMLLFFRPFKVGDYVKAAGVDGTVDEIELFITRLVTLDHHLIIVPNGKLFGDVIENYGFYDKRRVDVDVGTDYGADLDEVRKVLESAVELVDHKIMDPAPQVFLKGLGASSIDWQLRIYTKREDYWSTYQEMIRAIKISLDKAEIGIPFPQRDVHFDDAVVKAITGGKAA